MWKPGHPDNNGRRTPSYHQPFESVQDSGNGKKDLLDIAGVLQECLMC